MLNNCKSGLEWPFTFQSEDEMSTVNVEELANDVARMSRAIARCLHYLAEEIPESRRSDYLLLLNDVHDKQAKLVHALSTESVVRACDHATL
jgi:hypothetical protein